jgi:hypothetical protein
MVHNDTCIKRSQISYNVNLHMKYDCPRWFINVLILLRMCIESLNLICSYS